MAKARGDVDAPLLVTMVSEPSDGMLSWFWKVVGDECGIAKTDVRLVFLIDEPPAGTGNKPLKSQIKAAWPRFSQELKESRPRVVLAMEGSTLQPLTGITQTIMDARGYVIDKDFFHNMPIQTYEKIGEYKSNAKGHKKGDDRFGNVTRSSAGLLGADFAGVVIPTFGLDHIRMEQFAIRPAFKEDVKRCRRALDGGLFMLDDRLEKHGFYIDFGVMRNTAGLEWVADKNLNDVEWGEIIAVDIETHGVNNEVIDLVSFSDGVNSGVLHWSSAAREFMIRLFSLPGRYYAIHNSPFDLPRLRANGVFISDHVMDHRIIDTMFGVVVVQSDLHKSLARAITVYHDIKPWKGQRKSMWHEMSLKDPIFYSVKDAFATAHLGISLRTVMKNFGVWNLFMGEGSHPGPGVTATIPELTTMSREGIRTDREYAEVWTKELEERALGLEQQWAEQFPGMNPHSTQEVADLLYRQWGLPIQKTKTDGVTTDELALVRLKHFIGSEYARKYSPGVWLEDARCNTGLFDLLLDIRDASKTLSTYVQPIAMDAETWVHPSYMPVSKDDEHAKGRFGIGINHSKATTCTGRLATYGPNIQNQPKKVRRLYIPDTADMTFVQADYKSAELYVMAFMAKDDRLLEDLRSGDMHSRNAIRFNCSRDTAKNVIYAGQYLAGAAKVSEMILEQEHMYIPVDEVKRILNEIKTYYFKTHAYKMHLVNMCEVKKYVRNPLGRVRFFHDGRSPAAVDFIPQSVVADVLWCVLRPVAEMARAFGGRMTTTVHDSVLVQVPSAVADQVAREMVRLMEKRFDIIAPDFYIPVEIEMGRPGGSWSELSKYVLS